MRVLLVDLLLLISTVTGTLICFVMDQMVARKLSMALLLVSVDEEPAGSSAALPGPASGSGSEAGRVPNRLMAAAASAHGSQLAKTARGL